MTKKTLLIAAAIVFVPALATLAGMSYPMKCDHCGYSTRVVVGGGRLFEQITGYCPGDKKFVSITWKRDEKKPAPMARVWDASTGKTIDLYKCPDCGKPFIALEVKDTDVDGPGFDHCPRCGHKTFKLNKEEGIMAID